MTKKKPTMPPIHPGEVLLEDFMKPDAISINQLARDLRVPVTRISAIVNGARGISGDTALRLSRYFGNSAAFWMNLQKHYEISMAEDAAGEQIALDVRPRKAA
jgi:addiction module HigA family antidote